MSDFYDNDKRGDTPLYEDNNLEKEFPNQDMPASEMPSKQTEDGDSTYHFTKAQLPQQEKAEAPFEPGQPYAYRFSGDSRTEKKQSASGTPGMENAFVKEDGTPGRKKKTGGRFLKVASVLLVGALVGGAGGGATVYTMMKNNAAETASMFQSAVTTTNAPAAETPASSSTVKTSTASGVLTAQEIYELGCRQVVGITTEVTSTNVFGQASGSAVTGSGFIITEDGYILTNYHVVETAVQYGYDITVMLNDGSTYTAEFIGREKDSTDVAVIKIDATGLTPATIGSSDSMQVGETIYAVGNPLGELTYSITSGIVSALDREITFTDSTSGGQANTINMFQFDAAVNSGNSGGPVYNEKGEVVGIVTAKTSSTGVEGIGFAIPIDDAISLAEELMANGYVSGKPYLGVEVSSVDSATAAYYNLVEGAIVSTVNKGSCTEEAGIKAGDIITELAGEPVKSYADLKSVLSAYSAGDTVPITVYRSGETLTLQITFDEQGQETITTSQPENDSDNRLPSNSFPWGN